MVDPAANGELIHSSRPIRWPGLRKIPKNGSPSRAHDRVVQRSAGLPDAQALVPRGDRLEIGRHEALDVIPDRGRQLGGVLDHEAGPAVERTPHAERDGERIAALDRAIARAEQPEARPRPGGQHGVAGQRHPVPVEQTHGLALGHPRPQPGQHAADARWTSGRRRTRARPAARPRSWRAGQSPRRSAGPSRSRPGRPGRSAGAARRRGTPASPSRLGPRTSSSRRPRPVVRHRRLRRRGSRPAAGIDRVAARAG